MRTVPPPFAPPCRTIAIAQLRGELDRKLRRDLPLPPELFLEALVRTGMAEGEPATLYQHLLDFYGSQVLGFYEPRGDEMVLIQGGISDEMPRHMVWAHEMAHAAQEHRFRLPSRLLGIRDNGDRPRAASAIAEGEAMLVMMLLDAAAGSENDDARLEAAAEALAAQAASFAAPDGIPDYFVQDLLFPYSSGFEAVLRAYRGGGWDAVDALLAEPPASTAILLYPDLGEPGTSVVDGELPSPPTGWEQVLADTLGAWGLRFWLTRAVPAAQAQELASQWAGDRLRLIRKRDTPECWALAWRLRCRTEAGRVSLQRTLERHLPTLLAGLCPQQAPAELTWFGAARSLDVRVAWPRRPSRAPTSRR